MKRIEKDKQCVDITGKEVEERCNRISLRELFQKMMQNIK